MLKELNGGDDKRLTPVVMSTTTTLCLGPADPLKGPELQG
jgi:hypothetical protein